MFNVKKEAKYITPVLSSFFLLLVFLFALLYYCHHYYLPYIFVGLRFFFNLDSNWIYKVLREITATMNKKKWKRNSGSYLKMRNFESFAYFSFFSGKQEKKGFYRFLHLLARFASIIYKKKRKKHSCLLPATLGGLYDNVNFPLSLLFFAAPLIVPINLHTCMLCRFSLAAILSKWYFFSPRVYNV